MVVGGTQFNPLQVVTAKGVTSLSQGLEWIWKLFIIHPTNPEGELGSWPGGGGPLGGDLRSRILSLWFLEERGL